jgi:hypothetical protein
MVTLASDFFDGYNQTADDFINSNFGVNCTLLYPAKDVECENCIVDTINRCSTNQYNGTGPYPFTFGICPYCEGNGYKSEQPTENIKMRVYFTPKSWVKISIPVNIPDGSIQTIGFMSDLPKVLKSKTVIINPNLSPINDWSYALLTHPVPHGFNQRYFIAFWSK